MSEYEFKNGIKHGKYCIYRVNGTIQEQGKYENGNKKKYMNI